MKQIFAFSIAALFFISNALFAQTPSTKKSLSPYFQVKSNNPETDALPLKNTNVDVRISGVIADVTVEQVYKNEGKNALEAIYTFPASTNAAVYAMEMRIGDRIIKAKIEEKKKARKDYEKAKKEGKRVSLLEQKRPNVFTMNVANIMPDDEISVTLKYTEYLIPEDGKYQLVYPTVVGPRYSNETQTDDNKDNFVKTPFQKEGEESCYDFDINVKVAAGVPIQDINSPSHDIRINFPKTDIANAYLDATDTKSGNRDFVLDYKLAGDDINSGIMLYEHEDENFFLMMVQPPKRIVEKNIPPREYIFINDVSGSMNGYPMDVSKKIMRNLISNLRPEDRFNVLVFAGTSGWMNDKSVPATKDYIDKAVAFIDTQRGSGGTEIIHALNKALDFPREYESLSRSFVIVTDGYVTVEKDVFDLIRNNNNQANTFIFGIGGSVNRYLIEGIARAGMSEPIIVLDDSETNSKAEKFREYISQPVLTQIKVNYPKDFEVYDVQPLTVPDVFANRPIIVYGKYKGTPSGKIQLKGYAGRKRWKAEIDVSKALSNKNNEALRYLWARKQIQTLDDYGSLGYGENKNKEAVTELGLKYNLLTNYTSFIAIEEKIVNINGVETIKQTVPLPKNVSKAAVGFDLELEEDIDLTSISLFSNIKIVSANINANLKAKLITEIEEKIKAELNNCLLSAANLDNIGIELNSDGTVANILLEEQNFDASSIKCLKEIISTWNFAELNNGQALKFEIQF